MLLRIAIGWLTLALAASAQTIAENVIPFPALSPANQGLVRAVTDHYTLRREYPPERFTGRTAHFDFLMNHMAACSMLAERLGSIRYHATEDAAGRVWADDREGSRGYLQRMYGSEGRYVYYVAGAEDGVFEVRGRGVAVIQTKPVAPDQLEYRATLFVKVDNTVLAMLTQLFQVFVRGSVDKHFAHVMRHPVELTRLAASEPGKIRSAIQALPADEQPLLKEFEQQL